MLRAQEIGRIRPSIAWSGLASVLSTGQAMRTTMSDVLGRITALAAAKDDGFRCAQPILRARYYDPTNNISVVRDNATGNVITVRSGN